MGPSLQWIIGNYSIWKVEKQWSAASRDHGVPQTVIAFLMATAKTSFVTHTHSNTHTYTCTHIHIRARTDTLEQRADHPGSNTSLCHELSEGDLYEEERDPTNDDTDKVGDQKRSWKLKHRSNTEKNVKKIKQEIMELMALLIGFLMDMTSAWRKHLKWKFLFLTVLMMIVKTTTWCLFVAKPCKRGNSPNNGCWENVQKHVEYIW